MKKPVRLRKVYFLGRSRHNGFLGRLPGRIGLAANPLSAPARQMFEGIATRSISFAFRLMKAHSLRSRWYYPAVHFAFALPIFLRTVLRSSATRYSSYVVIPGKWVAQARDLVQYFFWIHEDTWRLRGYPRTLISSITSVAAKNYVNTVAQLIALHYRSSPALKPWATPGGLTRTSVEVQKMAFVPTPYGGETRLGMAPSAWPAITRLLLQGSRLTHSMRTVGFRMNGVLRTSNTHSDFFMLSNQIARLSYKKGSARVHDRGWSPSATTFYVPPPREASNFSRKGGMANAHNAAYAVKSTVAQSTSIGRITRREGTRRHSPAMAFRNIVQRLPRHSHHSHRMAAAGRGVVRDGDQTWLTLLKPLTFSHTVGAPGLVHRQHEHSESRPPRAGQAGHSEQDISAVPHPLPMGIVEAPMVSQMPDIQRLTDQVIHVIEDRLKTERERRGIFT